LEIRMGWNRRRVLAGVAVAAAAAPGAGIGYAPGPALWAVEERGARVFLFGDNPAQRTPWRSERIEAALRSSAVFWRETPVAQPGGMALFLAKGVDPARPLSSWLTRSDHARVSAAAEAVGLTAAGLERLRPWLAAVVLEDRFNAHAGFRPENGPTQDLTAIAHAQGMPIRSEFPDIAAVVDYFASFSAAAEVGSLLRALDDVEAGADEAEREGLAWAKGDQHADLAAVLRMRKRYRDYYQRILVERNRRWRARIRAMLDGGGTSFVLVGGAHLVGPDSVQSQLAGAGMVARRI
jgi:hypothetical protein